MTAFVVTQFQGKILNTEERVNVLTPPAGCGMTYGLMLKAVLAANEGKHVVAHVHHRPGCWTVDAAVQLAQKVGKTRFSAHSMILSVGEGKIKFMTVQNDHYQLQGYNTDLVVVDHHITNDQVQSHLLRARHIVLGTSIKNIMLNPDHWARKYDMLTYVDGVPSGFQPWVNHITTSHEKCGAFEFEGYESYMQNLKSLKCEEGALLMRGEFPIVKSHNHIPGVEGWSIDKSGALEINSKEK